MKNLLTFTMLTIGAALFVSTAACGGASDEDPSREASESAAIKARKAARDSGTSDGTNGGPGPDPDAPVTGSPPTNGGGTPPPVTLCPESKCPAQASMIGIECNGGTTTYQCLAYGTSPCAWEPTCVK